MRVEGKAEIHNRGDDMVLVCWLRSENPHFENPHFSLKRREVGHLLKKHGRASRVTAR